MRSGYELEDTQKCIVAMLDSVTDSPLADAEIIFGYPESERFLKFTKPFIYVLEPILIERHYQQGGIPVEYIYSITIGLWTDNNTGGIEEINLISSYLVTFFEDKKKCHSTQKFTVKLGNTTYTNTDLITQGIRIYEISDYRFILSDIEDLKEHRKELTIIVGV